MDKTIFQQNPLSGKCDCIICHQKDVPSSDEHIIPKSIGGYMHSWNVCKECNSRFGNNVDTKLVNHSLIKWDRYFHQLKGESGKDVPNPFEGTHVATDGEKYKITDDSGILTPHIIQQIKLSDDGSQVLLAIDPKDKDKAESIMRTFCKRKGIPYDSNNAQISHVKTKESPKFEMSIEVDIASFRLGIVKIAYEFTASLIPSYLSDINAINISSILSEAEVSRLSEIEFGGNAFEDIFPQMFGHVIDFSNKKRHYILLLNLNGQLWCFVKLFNVFCIGIKMSDKPYVEANEKIIAINDFQKQDFDLFTLEELITSTQRFESIGCRFTDGWDNWFKSVSGNSNVGFYCDKDMHNLCFNMLGRHIGSDIEIIRQYPEELVDTVFQGDKVVTSYNVSGRFCYCLAPQNIFIPIKEIVMTSTISKF